MNQDRERLQKLTLLAGFAALALVAMAFLHVCLSSCGHGEDCDPNHHCLLCAVFGCTLLGISLSDLLASPLIIHLAIFLKPICGEKLSVLLAFPVRAPPSVRF